MSSRNIDKAVLRQCESALLRAEAALERHSAKRMRQRDGSSDDFLMRDLEADELHAKVADAKADLLEAQADYVLTHTDEAEEARA